jgi:hypothetical protein
MTIFNLILCLGRFINLILFLGRFINLILFLGRFINLILFLGQFINLILFLRTILLYFWSGGLVNGMITSTRHSGNDFTVFLQRGRRPRAALRCLVTGLYQILSNRRVY